MKRFIVLLVFGLFINLFLMGEQKRETAILGGGCFWCLEAVFQKVKGVEAVISGYSGGNVKNPAYREVTTGRTGHAEVVKIIYNPEVIPYEVLLSIFFTIHDPTTLNRQGADVGTQYRSVIFYMNDSQKAIAEKIMAQLEAEKVYNDPLVTQLVKEVPFYEAEEYHQNYYLNNTGQPYCQVVISPKVSKFRNRFTDWVQ